MFGSRLQAPTLDILDDVDTPNLHGSSTDRKGQRVQRLRKQDVQFPSHISRQYEHCTFEPQVKRQASKGRLLGFFNRTRSTKAAAARAGQGIEVNGLDQEGHSIPPFDAASSVHKIEDFAIDDMMPITESTKQQPLKAKRSKSFKKSPATIKSIPWDPPPLFQAYPQSVKHGTALAPTMSADMILRHHAERKRKSRKLSASARASGVDRLGELSHGDEPDELQEVELGQKIYVLATSGYILQYAGEGSFDRLPEKIMAIGQESAAFASDAIPGKHWVLQVSHALDEKAKPKLGKRSFVKRLGLGVDIKRCSALNFLLVLDDPEDLDSWLSVVKREFEAWGGRRYQPESTVGAYVDERLPTLHQKPSRRYLVKRDPNQFSSVAKEPSVAFDEAILGVTPPSTLRKHSTATQESVHSPSTSNMTTSTDQNRLDRLRNSPRMSYISTGAKTYATSRETSPIPSPSRLNFHLDDFSCRHEQSEKVDSSVKANIESPVMHLPQEPLDQSLPSTLTRPLSTVKGSPGKSPAAGAPNFSVPSFSKRYSSAHSSPPPLSTASSTTSNPSRKATSPPTIAEQHSDFQIIDDAAAEASATELSDPEASSVAELKQPVPLHASTERVAPRRFSSLEYCRGVRPAHSTSPHPPPTSALPALPETGTGNLSAPTPILRRPISAQNHSCPLLSTAAEPHSLLAPLPSPTTSRNNLPSSPPSRAAPPPPPPVSSTVSAQSSDQRLIPPATKMLNRRSMPHLSSPLSDPPDCPLPVPPVPRLLPIKLSSGSLRRSVERPLRAGLGARTAGLVEGDEV
ncbi:MAG: hypothetical protein Q9210_001743 [Variospora velana]